MEILSRKEKAYKFSKILQDAALIMAPDLYIVELTNTIWKYYRANILTKDECVQYIKDGINMVVTRRHGGVLITNDSVLAEICKETIYKYVIREKRQLRRGQVN
jgi:predicted nucleic acid-binding protein